MHSLRLPAFWRHLLVALGFCAASWGFFAPPGGWARGVYFGYGQDPIAFSWFLNWWPFAIRQHLPLLFTRYADWPAGTDLTWKTCVPALGLLAAPFTARFGPMPVYNVLMLASPALAGFGLYLAAWALTADFVASLAAGVLLGISGYEMGQGQGHLNLAFTLALPLCVWACVRAAQLGWPRWALALMLGGLLAFEFGTSQEVFASAMLFGGFTLAAIWWLHEPARPALRRLAPGIGGGLGLCLVLISSFMWQMLRSYGAAKGSISLPDDYGNDALAFITPTPLSFFGGQLAVPITKHFAGSYTEQNGYFSAPLLLLLGHIVRRGGGVERVLGAVFVAALLVSLGPFLHVLGFRLSTAPWLFAYRLPLLGAILPCRMSLYGWLAAGLLLARWLAARPDARRLWLALLCLLVLAPAQSYDRNWRVLAPPPVFASLPQGAHVLVLPEFGLEMGWQFAAHMRYFAVGQGYLGTGLPAPFRNWQLFLPLWQNHFALIDPRAFAAYLAAYQVQYVVVMPSGYDFYGPKMNQLATAAAARDLLGQAGWRLQSATVQADLFVPGAKPPNAAAIAAYAALRPDAAGTAEARRAKLLRRETLNVCAIRKVLAPLHVGPAPVLRIYARLVALPVPPGGISCGAEP